MNDTDTNLFNLAQLASKNAYAPYSKFSVGCAILSELGNTYTGCNVENISFGLTNCAERTAVFKGVSDEGKKFKITKVVIFTPTDIPISPCGACRQVLSEFGDSFPIISFCEGDKRIETSIDTLLPDPPNIQL